jgi:hypothetical protein
MHADRAQEQICLVQVRVGIIFSGSTDLQGLIQKFAMSEDASKDIER